MDAYLKLLTPCSIPRSSPYTHPHSSLIVALQVNALQSFSFCCASADSREGPKLEWRGCRALGLGF